MQLAGSQEYAEYMSLLVDMTTRRSDPFPDKVLAPLKGMAEAYAYAQHQRPVR